jgi:hypothetical protein
MTSQFTGIPAPFRRPHPSTDRFSPQEASIEPQESSSSIGPQESISSIEYPTSSVTVVVETTTSIVPPTSTLLTDGARSASGTSTSEDAKTKLIGGIIGGFFLGVLVTVAIFMALCRRRRTQVTRRDTEGASKRCSPYNCYMV